MWYDSMTHNSQNIRNSDFNTKKWCVLAFHAYNIFREDHTRPTTKIFKTIVVIDRRVLSSV